MDRLLVERLGGLAGLGGPRSRIRSCGELDLKSLSAADRRAVANLFLSYAHPTGQSPGGAPPPGQTTPDEISPGKIPPGKISPSKISPSHNSPGDPTPGPTRGTKSRGKSHDPLGTSPPRTSTSRPAPPCDRFTYRITRVTGDGRIAIEVPEDAVPASLLQCVRDELI